MKSSSIIRIPKHWKSKPSHALEADQLSRIGKQLSSAGFMEREGAGLRLVEREDDALAIRIALIEQADHSLDMQYYKWLDDSSGSLLLSHVIAAADRGVRVRLLIDDIHFDADLNAQALDHHPNVEIRLFNPFESRRMTPLTRPLEWLRNDRVNHRMHNKLIVSDSLVALCGGRNISDNYYGLSPRVTFRDLDLLVVGKVVAQMGQAFDDYWNSRWAVPVASLFKVSLPTRQRRRLQALLRRFKRSRQYVHGARLQELASHPILPITEGVIWAPAEVIYDPPEKVQKGRAATDERSGAFFDAINNVSKSLLLVSPYLIPTPGMLALLKRLKEKGVRTHILTNSLASNDVVMAHGGYRAYRKKLLKLGARIFELSPSGRYEPAAPSPYSLHTKAIVMDEEHLFIGTHNADPRSLNLNTEMGLLIRSPELARQVTQGIQEHIGNGNSWRVFRRFDRLFWRRCRDDQVELKWVDPECSRFRRWLARFCSWLPIHHQL